MSTRQSAKCSQALTIKCELVCDRLLNCGRHFCKAKCHSGSCDKCEVLLTQGMCYIILLLLLLLLLLLAHLSTKCSVSFCDPSMSGVRRPSVRASVRPCVRPSTISLNYISSETAYWILTKLHRNDPWVVPYQSCSNRSSWLHK